MIGIVICTHSTFAQGLKSAAEMIAGPQENLKAICFDGQEDLMSLGMRVKEAGEEFDECIYVVDLINATPFNASLIAIAETDNVILCGASIPMMIELLIKRNGYEGSAEDLAKEIVASSGDYVEVRHSRDVFK